jgi:3-oxoacyl-[acyl-carrier-protein] synthase II
MHAPDDGNEDLDFVPLTAKARQITAALCNGFGFGGVNAAIVMRGV